MSPGATLPNTATLFHEERIGVSAQDDGQNNER
jgi:hypothetical protein